MTTTPLNPKWVKLFNTIKELKALGVDTTSLETQLKEIPKLASGTTFDELTQQNEQEHEIQPKPPKKLIKIKQPTQKPPKKQPKPKPTSDLILAGRTYTIGKNKQYTSITQLANEKGIDVEALKSIRNGNVERVIRTKEGLTDTFDITKPLLLRFFKDALDMKKSPSMKELVEGKTFYDRKGNMSVIAPELPTGTPINVYVKVSYWFKYSADLVIRNIGFQLNIKTGEDITKLILEHILNKYTRLENMVYLEDERTNGRPRTNEMAPLPLFESSSHRIAGNGIEVFRSNDGKQMQLVDMVLRDETPPNIDNLYGEVIYNENWKHCIHDYIDNLYNANRKVKAFSNSYIETLNTTADIHKFSVKHNIKMIAYDINKNIIASNYPEKTSRLKNIVFIAHNSHLYPLKHCVLNRNKPIIKTVKIVDNIEDKIIELYFTNKSYPIISEFYKTEIISIIDDNIKYIQNDEYLRCEEILIKYGLLDKIYDSIKLINIISILSQLYTKTNDNSIWFGHNKFAIGGFRYSNKTLQCNDNEKFITIDQNKAFSSCLSELEYLITVDMVNTNLDANLSLNEDHYIYIVEPERSSILIPEMGAYTGSFLKFCKEQGLIFTITEKLPTTTINNHYKLMINELYDNLDENIFKTSINKFIGTFEENRGLKSKTNFIKLCDDAELETINENEYSRCITDNLHYIFTESTTHSIYSKKPIAIQIKEEARKRTYLKLVELNIRDEDIKSINTDSICFKQNNTHKEISNIGKGLNQWKFEKYKQFNADFNYSNNIKLSFIETTPNNNTIGLCYAGCGKTYKLIHAIIPNLESNDYIVLTPSHSSLKEYRALKFNCNVIQKYTLDKNKITPKEAVIIIDEIGMCSRDAILLLIKWSSMGKHIIAYGDYKQLLPIGESKPLYSNLLQSYLFKNIDIMTENRRNNLDISFYDALINGKCDNKKAIIKFRNINSNTVICHRNSTRKQYNEIICKKLNINTMSNIGCKVICKSNELSDKDIYNNFIYTIKAFNNDKITLNSDEEITLEELSKHFEYGYARTLHSAQGETLSDFYYPNEDLDIIDGRFTYTLISRLSGKFQKMKGIEGTL